jgi:hypothetical protein
LRRLLNRHRGFRLRPRFLGLLDGLNLRANFHLRSLLPIAVSRLDFKAEPPAHQMRDVLVDRARVRLLLGDAKLRQEVENHFRFDLQLPGQLIDSNILHIAERGSDAAYQSRYQSAKITFRQP